MEKFIEKHRWVILITLLALYVAGELVSKYIIWIL